METGEREFLHDHLLASQQRVADELASPQGNGGVGHFGGVVVMQRGTVWIVFTFNFRAVRLG